MKHILKLAVVALLAAGLVSAAKAPGRKAVRNQVFKALNLSQDQKVQARTIFQDAVQSAKPVAQQLKQNREALAVAVTGNDAPKIQQLSTEQGQLRGQILGIRSGAMSKFLGILTPEQRTAAEQARLTFKDLLRKRLGAG
jgi:Spy/CpxP family protein refolding chaperone